MQRVLIGTPKEYKHPCKKFRDFKVQLARTRDSVLAT
jgi:hypothetical protein